MATESVEEVKVLGAWASPFALRPRIALNLKGVGYELLEETMEAKSELLLKSNPVYKKVPVLVHNGKPICESMIIVDYIDEVWKDKETSILPADPYDRAIARFWAAYIDNTFFPAMRGMATAQAEAGAQVSAALQQLEEAFQYCSKGKGFFGGDAVGYVDIALGCFLGWIEASGKLVGMNLLDEKKTPLLAGWAERFRANAAVKEVMPETDKLVEVAKMLQAKWKAAPPAK